MLLAGCQTVSYDLHTFPTHRRRLKTAAANLFAGMLPASLHPVCLTHGHSCWYSNLKDLQAESIVWKPIHNMGIVDIYTRVHVSVYMYNIYMYTSYIFHTKLHQVWGWTMSFCLCHHIFELKLCWRKVRTSSLEVCAFWISFLVSSSVCACLKGTNRRIKILQKLWSST